MQGCFDCGKCGDCNKFIEIENKCKAKGLLAFRADVKNWEVVYRGRNKHIKIIPRDWFQLFSTFQLIDFQVGKYLRKQTCFY